MNIYMYTAFVGWGECEGNKRGRRTRFIVSCKMGGLYRMRGRTHFIVSCRMILVVHVGDSNHKRSRKNVCYPKIKKE